MYSLDHYANMFADSVRMDAYAAALESAVTEGGVVVDIGSGTGILALIACRLGAAEVFAIESGNAIELARRTAEANGLSERIHWIQALSTQTNLPRSADVVVSDLRGRLPLYQQHLPAIIDARTRLLKPGGKLIPECDRIYCALVENEAEYTRLVGPWENGRTGLDLRIGRSFVINSMYHSKCEASNMLSAPWCLGAIDYRTVKDANFAGMATCEVNRAGMGHGICVWFDTTLYESIGFSCAPTEPRTIYGQAFFPWPQPVELTPGDRVDVSLRANLVGGDYVWRWDTRVREIRFSQSDFFREPISPSIKKRFEDFAPRLSEAGAIDRMVLEAMAKTLPLREIAMQLAESFPHKWKDWRAALPRVGELSEKYSD